jgi:hypothetical protein
MNPVRAGLSKTPEEWPYQGEITNLPFDRQTQTTATKRRGYITISPSLVLTSLAAP